MSSLVYTDVKTYLGEYDISGFMNKVMLDYGAQALKDTRMGHTTEINKGGVKTVKFDIAGFADPATAGMEAIAFGKIATSGIPLTASPTGAAAGDPAYCFQVLNQNMKTFGKHGELMPFGGTAVSGGSSVSGSAANALVRGKVFVSANTAKTSTSTSSIIQLGAVTATQRVYAFAHCIDTVAGSSPTLNITVKSAALVGFGSPTTRLTFTQFVAKSSEVQSAAGAITDQFWRVDYTIGGTGGPSFPFIVVVGIV